MPSTRSEQPPGPILQAKRVAFVGRLASMSRKEASQLAREHGAVVVDRPDPSTDLVVVGEAGLALLDPAEGEQLLDRATRDAAEQGAVEIVTETGLWQRLGLVEDDQAIRQLYTPAMLARLLDVPVAVVRRWHRRGLIRPVREVRRLPYFDFQEVATARRLAELLAAGMSPAAIERKLEELARVVPGVQRPLAQLSVIVRGREILLRQGDGLLEPGGQLRFDFEAAERPARAVVAMPQDEPGLPEGPWRVTASDAPPAIEPGADLDHPPSPTPETMCRVAAELEEEGRLKEAAEMYRASLAAAGPKAETCFLLAELLYRLGEVGAARERYYMAVELDEDYVEARNCLGCVLAETGEGELAVAALQGALAYHPDYADAHYHLARLLDERGRSGEAEVHWQAFIELAPDSPWSDEARARLARPS